MSGFELVLSPDVLAQVIAHCAEVSPREAVGLLGGRVGGTVDVALPLVNIVSSDQAFIADPHSQFRAFRRLESDGHDLLAIYHSHPGGGVHPSDEDLVYAKLWPCAHLIVAMSEGTGEGGGVRLGGFRRVADGIEEVTVRLPNA